MKTYRQIWEAPKPFRSDKWDHYLDLYDRYLAPYRAQALDGRPVTYLEIGVQGGGSLFTAREYFGPEARIFGIDVDPASTAVAEAGVADRVFIGQQGDFDFLNEVIAAIGTPDIVIDDGSHQQGDMVTTFLGLFPVLAENGLYVVEDTHTIHYPSHQDTTLGINVYDYFKGLADKMMPDFMVPNRHRARFREHPDQREGQLERRNSIGTAIGGLHFHDSMIVVEKTPYREAWRRNA
ncbi:class I SAM-dependent methyltransferase [Falsiroseomonas ponticola]|jgi:hypothetical protein|uniref:class I SAM-dependent methyltransferase n=1 Tax=Falsiroseomonas ponticola TaxID=2786951 RepID=UPI001933BDEB|nr:class I SAM-dependent methyltransferase [Roseomonas ponticola]